MNLISWSRLSPMDTEPVDECACWSSRFLLDALLRLCDVMELVGVEAVHSGWVAISPLLLQNCFSFLIDGAQSN